MREFAEAEYKELPDDLRVPLHELQADLNWLVARIAAGDEVEQMKHSIGNRLSQIETAAYRLANPEPRKPDAEPIMYAWHGPHGGWLTDVVKPSWRSTPLYDHPASSKPDAVTDAMVKAAHEAHAAAMWKGEDRMRAAIKAALEAAAQERKP